MLIYQIIMDSLSHSKEDERKFTKLNNPKATKNIIVSIAIMWPLSIYSTITYLIFHDFGIISFLNDLSSSIFGVLFNIINSFVNEIDKICNYYKIIKEFIKNVFTILLKYFIIILILPIIFVQKNYEEIRNRTNQFYNSCSTFLNCFYTKSLNIANYIKHLFSSNIEKK